MESFAMVGWSCTAEVLTPIEATIRMKNMKIHVRCSLYFKSGILLRDLQPSGQIVEQFTTKRERSVELFAFGMVPRLKTIARSAEDFARRVLRPRAYMESTFAPFYKENRWGDEESVSGPGSSLARTAKLRRELPPLLREVGARTLLDAP